MAQQNPPAPQPGYWQMANRLATFTLTPAGVIHDFELLTAPCTLCFGAVEVTPGHTFCYGEEVVVDGIA
jgi:hypothetical protein